jgi:GT2 family glycosyltransferase
LQPHRVTVVIPTLSADFALWDCVQSLQRQSLREFAIVIVDNSGAGRVDANWPDALPRRAATVLQPHSNLGFGAAINLAARLHPAEYIAVINDDAVADPDWLRQLVLALDQHPLAGSAASQVRLHHLPSALDSAAMLIAADGSSKQRGHGQDPVHFQDPEEALLASGSASLYRQAMLSQTGGFDDAFFLYCEDTDLGLRARWAGWSCRYVPSAIVHHRYSHSAGRASRLKAYYVERNRLLLIGKNFPLLRLLRAFAATPLRYLHHLLAMRRGVGAAAHFHQSGESPWILVACVLRAHLSALALLPSIYRQRRRIRGSARISPAQFNAALDRFSISLREVAAL